jgi:hypothetical protein
MFATDPPGAAASPPSGRDGGLFSGCGGRILGRDRLASLPLWLRAPPGVATSSSGAMSSSGTATCTGATSSGETCGGVASSTTGEVGSMLATVESGGIYDVNGEAGSQLARGGPKCRVGIFKKTKIFPEAFTECAIFGSRGRWLPHETLPRVRNQRSERLGRNTVPRAGRRLGVI